MKKKTTKKTVKRKPDIVDDMSAALIKISDRHGICELAAAEEMFKFCAFLATDAFGKKHALKLLVKTIKQVIKENGGI